MPTCPKCGHAWRTEAQREWDREREKTREPRDRAAYMRKYRKRRKK